MRGFEHHNALVVHAARTIALAEIMNPGVLEVLERHLEGLRGVDLPNKDKMPKHVASTLNSKQWSGLRVARHFQWVWGSDGSEVKISEIRSPSSLEGPQVPKRLRQSIRPDRRVHVFPTRLHAQPPSGGPGRPRLGGPATALFFVGESAPRPG